MLQKKKKKYKPRHINSNPINNILKEYYNILSTKICII